MAFARPPRGPRLRACGRSRSTACGALTRAPRRSRTCFLGIPSVTGGPSPVRPRCWASRLLSFLPRLPSQVAVDMEFAKNMYELHKKVSPNELILGW